MEEREWLWCGIFGDSVPALTNPNIGNVPVGASPLEAMVASPKTNRGSPCVGQCAIITAGGGQSL